MMDTYDVVILGAGSTIGSSSVRFSLTPRLASLE